MKHLLVSLSPCLLILLIACHPQPNPAQQLAAHATANPALIATAQADQYWRDAQATTQSYQTTLQANYQNVQATAQSATATSQAQATAALATQQARSTATTQAQHNAQATSTAAAQSTAAAFVATRQTLELQQARAQAQREQLTTAASTAFLVFTAVLVVGLAAWFFLQITPTLINRAGLIRYGQHGNPLLLIERNGRTIITDPLAMLQAAAIIDQNAAVTMPQLTPDALQSYLAAGRLRLLLEQAHHAPGHPPQFPAETTTQRRLGPLESSQTVRHGRPSATTNSPTLLAAGGSSSFTDEGMRFPAAVSWQQLTTWPGPGLALGAGAGPQQPVVALDLARTPHLFVAGMSGSGKTRRLLRPLIAQALTAGYYAILLNESAADFSPFYHHPNITIVRGTAADYAAVLQAAMSEVTRREALLRSAGVSEWQRLPPGQQPPLLLAIDELLALVMLLSAAEQREFWGLFAAFASRARKVGMSSLGLATDPTYRALGQGGLNYRSQCGRLSFRVMQAAGSRAVLDQGGAEALADGQFLALLDRPGVVPGMTADPADSELHDYLSRHAAPVLERPEWLTAVEARPLVAPVDETEQRIRQLTAEGLSMRAVQQHIFGYVGGKAYDVVKPIYEAVRAGGITGGDTGG